ncbi:MAG: hypothetical protein WC070_01910 [Candidatus Magasanikbacteria bacterium]
MSDSFLHILTTVLIVIILFLVYFAGYIAGSNGWYLLFLGVLVLFPIVFKLLKV